MQAAMKFLFSTDTILVMSFMQYHSGHYITKWHSFHFTKWTESRMYYFQVGTLIIWPLWKKIWCIKHCFTKHSNTMVLVDIFEFSSTAKNGKNLLYVLYVKLLYKTEYERNGDDSFQCT